MLHIVNSNLKKLLAIIMFLMMAFSMPPVVLAEQGANPLTFLGANLTTTNHLTESDPLKQVSTPGVSVMDNNSVPSGPQSIDIWIDKNIITDAHFAHNQSCITLKDVTSSSNVAVSFFRLGATDGTGIYKQHLYFDVTLVSGHKYQITIEGTIMANNGLTLITTNNVNFTVANDVAAPLPATPVVTNNDTLNTVTGMVTGMEYKLDAVGYVAYDKPTFDALDFSGAHTLLVRVAAAGIKPESAAVILTFTAAPTPPPTSTRLGGVTAAQTAVQIADQTGWTGTAILSSSASYGMVDALTAGPLATFLKAPILLQEAGNILNADTKAQLSKLKVMTVYVTSGTGVISQAVLDQLTGMGITVVPLGGVDRFATSVNIAQKMVELGAKVSKAALAYGWKNQDALSIASIASAQTEPILLTEKDSIPTSVKAFLSTNTSVKTTDVIGGTGVISDAVKAQLPGATRLSGNTAYDTNVAVLKAFDSVLKYNQIFVANGETAIDALAGVPLAAKYNAGILLTNGTTNEGFGYVRSKLSTASIASALGGTAVVPDSVLTGVLTAQP